MTLTHADMVIRVAETESITQADAKRVLDAATALMASALADGRDVSLRGVGTLRVKDRAARRGRNPRTGEDVEIPARRTVRIVVAKALKDALNNGQE